MKITLTGDHRRDISVQGIAAIQPNSSCWQEIMSSPALIEGLKHEVPSPLCQHLFPNLLSMKDVLLLTGFKKVDKLVYLSYLVHLLSKKPLKRTVGYYRGGPRAIIIVPTEKRVVSILQKLDEFKHNARINNHRVNLGRVVGMVGENPSFTVTDDVVIATPKGIGDFFDRNPKKVKILTFYLKHVIVDRADECCDISVGFHRKLKSCLGKLTKTWHPQILIIAQEPTLSIVELSGFMADTSKITLTCGFEVGYDDVDVEAAGGVVVVIGSQSSIGREQETASAGVDVNESQSSIGGEQEASAGIDVIGRQSTVGREQEEAAAVDELPRGERYRHSGM